MSDPSTSGPRRPGWVAATVVSGLFAATVAACGLLALSQVVRTGTSAWGIVTGAGSGVAFWGWISAGCWRRAIEPEPGPYDPAPVPRSKAFVVANAVLALLFTVLVGGGLWFGVEAAREADRVDLVRHRVMVAAREARLTVDDLAEVDVDRQAWLASGWADARADDHSSDREASNGDSSAGSDPLVELLPVDGATAIDLVIGDDGIAAVLFRPDEGPPCVVLDIDADGIMTTRSTGNCS